MRTACIIYIAMLLLGCQAQPQKINGLSLVASRDTISRQQIAPMLATQANYASIMPFGFVRDMNTPEVYFNSNRQWYGETVEGVKHYIDVLHAEGVQVMLKPQIWIMHGMYTGQMQMKTETDWQLLEQTYRDFMITFATVAAEKEVAIYCIGTELEAFVQQRPKYWQELIAEIKSIYTGKLTYAANWDEYKRVPFWQELDYIGIDAYFPISEEETPSVAEAKNGWTPWIAELENTSEAFQKPILFTEFGYRSRHYAGKEPWLSDRTEEDMNMEAQVNLLRGLYESVWQEPWMHGGFLWKWFIQHERVGGDQNTMFTPQNKPAERLLKEYYDVPKE